MFLCRRAGGCGRRALTPRWMASYRGLLTLGLLLTAVTLAALLLTLPAPHLNLAAKARWLELRGATASIAITTAADDLRRPRLVYADDVLGQGGEEVNVTSYLQCRDAEGKGAIEDILCMPRPDFLDNYKNPCFVDLAQPGQKVHCLPYFHVLGVDKSGTTDLHSRITMHPQVLPNSGGLGKEVYYWSWLKYGQFMKSTMNPMSFRNYVFVFDQAANIIASQVDESGHHHLITGDGTPMDFWDFRAWPLIPQNEGLKEPAVLNPHLMRHLYPDPKFIIIFRNPVDRLYSDYIFLGYGFTPEKFRQDVPKAIEFMDNCLKVNTTRQCVFSNDTYVNLNMRLHIGMYSVFMREWLAVFPRSCFYTLTTEDFRQNMAVHMKAIYQFLDLEPLPDHLLQEVLTASRKYETQAKKRVADMYPDTRQLLKDFYARYTEELAVLLDDPRFLWLS